MAQPFFLPKCLRPTALEMKSASEPATSHAAPFEIAMAGPNHKKLLPFLRGKSADNGSG
jgi:hypothetical protein